MSGGALLRVVASDGWLDVNTKTKLPTSLLRCQAAQALESLLTPATSTF